MVGKNEGESDRYERIPIFVTPCYKALGVTLAKRGTIYVKVVR